MRANTAPKFVTQPLSAEKYRRMKLSFGECEHLKERDLNCPYCNAPITGVFSDARGHLRVKCNKCKANMVLNLAYFRTMKGYGAFKQCRLASDLSTE